MKLRKGTKKNQRQNYVDESVMWVIRIIKSTVSLSTLFISKRLKRRLWHGGLEFRLLLQAVFACVAVAVYPSGAQHLNFVRVEASTSIGDLTR